MIEYHYICGECGKRETKTVSRKTIPLFKSEERFMREGGFCAHKWPTVEDMLPKDWGICLLGCCYCKECFEQIYPPEVSDQPPNAPDQGARQETTTGENP